MENRIAYCGLNCETCDARIATVTGDEALRQKTAALWSELNHAPITADMIYCEGCRGDGVKTPFCESMCEIRLCARKRGVDACESCADKAGCAALAAIQPNAGSDAAEEVR